MSSQFTAKKKTLLKIYVAIDFPAFPAPTSTALPRHNIDFPNAAKCSTPRLNYVQKITTLVVVKRTHTNTLARTCRKHNKSGVTINWVHFVFFRQVAGGSPPGKNHGRLCFLRPSPPPAPLPMFFFSLFPSFLNSDIFLPAKRLECGPPKRGLVRLFLVISEWPRQATQKYTTLNPDSLRFYVSSRLVESLSQQSFLIPYIKRRQFTRLSQKESKSVIVVRRHHLHVEVYTCYNK